MKKIIISFFISFAISFSIFYDESLKAFIVGLLFFIYTLILDKFNKK
jgi:hypothetical protein